jgi:hypothetical protein
MIFKQKFAKLHNGQKVRPGDTVSFVDSDGQTQTGKIAYGLRGDPKKLYFWNSRFDIESYQNAWVVR